MKEDDHQAAGGENDEAVIDMIGMNHVGESVRRAKGYILFVASALLSEKVR